MAELKATLAVAIAAAATLPADILILPAGEIPTRPHDGRAPWRNSNPEAVVTASADLRSDLPINYDHEGARTGRAAPAAGWIKRLFVRDGAIWGSVEWTARAARMLAEREYRFVSAEFMYTPDTRIVTRIIGAALTNDPALFMPAIASANHRGNDMDRREVAIALGLPEDASAEEIATAARTTAASRIESSVADLLKAGKLAPACKDAALALAAAAPDKWAAFTAGLPVIVPVGAVAPPGGPDSTAKPFLNLDVRAIASALEVSEGEYAASVNALARADTKDLADWR